MSLQHSYQALAEQEWIDIPTGWLQGRTIYGGLVAGLMMQKALLTLADDTKHLLSCSVTFVGPVQQAKVRLTSEILRQGKSVTTLEVRLWQDDAVQSILVASFGTQRESSIHVHQEPVAPAFPSVDGLTTAPHHPLARLEVRIDDRLYQSVPLDAAADVERGEIRERALDGFAEMFAGWWYRTIGSISIEDIVNLGALRGRHQG